MKLQKTLLAAALAVVGFSAQAADEKKGLANAFKYSNGTSELLKVTVLEGEQSLIKSGWYSIETKDSDGKNINSLKSFTGDTSAFNTLVSGGQLNIKTLEDSISVVEKIDGTTTDSGTNVDQNNYWSFGNASTTTTTTTTTDSSEYTVVGQLVNYDENGRITEQEAEVVFTGEFEPTTSVKTDVKAASVKKDVQIGNLTEEQRTAKAKYAFNIEKTESANVQGLVATIKTDAQVNTSVAAVTGNGLAVLSVPAGADVNLEKGTVSSTEIIGADTKSPRTELLAYDTTDGKRVVSYQGEYFTLDAANKSLTTYKGDTASLKLVGAGTAEETSGATEIKSVNTGLVSNKNVTYGESITKSTNEGRVLVGSTNPDVANSTSGTEYVVNESAKTVTSKDVVTGIISPDGEAKVYGLQATNIIDNKVTDQTTVTAEGIKTTGDITIFADSEKETTVGAYVESAAQKIDSVVSSRVNQLNSRISDVEKTAYRGVAIALAAQQQIPNIGAGQFAVFGGVGHYEGETAGSIGIANVFADGRTSLSAAVGVAGGSEVGGRVGVAYVFGGK